MTDAEYAMLALCVFGGAAYIACLMAGFFLGSKIRHDWSVAYSRAHGYKIHINESYGTKRFRCGNCGAWLGDVRGESLKINKRMKHWDDSILDTLPMPGGRSDCDYRFRYCPYCGMKIRWKDMPADDAMEKFEAARKAEGVGEYA